MGTKCPHCGEAIEITKFVDVTTSQPVDDQGDLGSGIVKSFDEALEAKVAEVDERTQALTGIHRLNDIANGNMSKNDEGLSAGWGGAMHSALKHRDKNPGAVSAEDIAGVDPERLDKDKAALVVQSLFMGSLSKSEKE